jgi:hypothetical protein
MLYIVPSGANDDWYWIYATVNANRRSAAYVVRIYSIAIFLHLLHVIILMLVLVFLLIFHLLVLVTQISVLLSLIFLPHLSYHYQSHLLFHLSPYHSPSPPPPPSPPLQVTNDMIRDHRLAFLEPRPFIRWRSTQVSHLLYHAE